jgi:hypothetical protein
LPWIESKLVFQKWLKGDSRCWLGRRPARMVKP